MALHTVGALPPRIVVFGATGHAVHLALDLREQLPDGVVLAGYADDHPATAGPVDAGLPVFSFDEVVSANDLGVVVAVHDPAGRRAVTERLSAAGAVIVGTSGDPRFAHPEAVIGEGSTVGMTTRLGHTTRLGRGCQVTGELVAHDVIVGDFTTIAVGARVLGHVDLGREVLVGPGALIANGTAERRVRIGDRAVIGTGAVVVGDLPDDAVVVGPRAMAPEDWSAVRRSAVDGR